MTTSFALLCQLAGLSHREAAEFLGVRLDTVKSWSAGRNPCPPGALDTMRGLISRQEIVSTEATQLAPDADVIELGEPRNDDEARTLGWPCLGAWRGMAARVVAGCRADMRIVPRGSTAATSAAIAARKSAR